MSLTGNWWRIALLWALAAFATATVVVAVQRHALEADLMDMRAKIDMYETLSNRDENESHRQKRNAREEINYRLPNTMTPTHYKLLLHPDLEMGTFTGQEEIRITVLERTNKIILHSHKLKITSIYVSNMEADFELDPVRQFLILTVSRELAVNEKITVGIVFEGESRGKLVGLYSSTYKTPAGVERNLATTKFEPTYARQAFPCFDEPAMKATFEISVIHPSEGSYDAVSNMNKESTMNLGANTMSKFATSVAMSTYLACIIVSDMDSEVGTVKANGIGEDFEMRAYATPHQLNKVKFALNFGTAVTEYYIKYYNVPYPLPKLDMAAIPDFASNAMEHWGLVTYRETALLYDENYGSTANKQSIAGTLAHEIAHQWFGNLVTMQWWNDVWLNEGFARYMQYKGVDAVFPDWGMLDQFQITALHPVMSFDAKLSSHPIVQKVESPDEISALFDTISYEKAGSILRMLENLVGSEVFEQAVTNYLKEYSFSNTITDNFLTHLAALVTDIDVKGLMRTWTEQMGYPVLNVERSSSEGFTITQHRYLSNQASYEETAEPSEFDYKWDVPVTYILNDKKVGNFIFKHTDDMAGIAVSSDVKWIKLNTHQVGFYRVNYEVPIWQEITKVLMTEHTSFDIADRAHLINDAFALADASQLTYDVPLDMTAYLANEKDFVPWHVASTKLRELKTILMKTNSFASYLEYARTLITNVYKEVGWTVDADNHLRNRLRVSVLTTACSLGLTDCLKEAAERFSIWINDPTPTNRPAPDLRDVVYYYGMQQLSGVVHWNKLFDLYKAESDASEKQKLLRGLAAVQDAQLLYRLLDEANDEKVVRSQDYVSCVQGIADNPVGEPVVWDYYREKWPQLSARFGLNDRSFGRLIASITDQFASEVKLEEVEEFYKKYPEAGAGTAPRKQALENIKANINWLQVNYEDIAKWLSVMIE